MNNIIKSASKLVLLSSSLALSVSFIFAVFTNQIEGSVIADIFKFFLGAVAGFYFAHKGEKDTEYLGK